MNNAVILAGGMGKRMKSDKPKVLLEVLGKPMLQWVIDACNDAGISNICVVKGYGADMLDEYLLGSLRTVLQPERLGTGHAVSCASCFLEEFSDGNTLIACGDSPFIDPETIKSSLELHIASKSAVTVITARLDNPRGYGRIIRSEDGIEGIVEEKDCSDSQRKINEISSGCYWFNTKKLLEALPRLQRNNSQGEYYLTDTISILKSDGCVAQAYLSDNQDSVLGANDRAGLLKLNDIARMKVIFKHLEAGVELISTDAVTISPDVKIAPGAKILPGSMLMGKTIIGRDSVIGPNTRLLNVTVGERSTLDNVVATDSRVGSDAKIGPFVQLRPGSVIADKAHIGNFVEIKNSAIGKGSSVSHLTYIGDSDVGKNVNFGCGTVTVNYDGSVKSRCEIGDNAFIGCNTNLVAPVKIGEAAYTAAGSTITKDVPDGALAIERGTQVIKEDYAKQKLKRHLEKGKALD
ncbi:MAG TPA: bifunctional UDP-N-acetylglucosamine diphosphorylase/glucosamine-1-phosphate N-acetyltransferase GlmU [Candidatus Faeciplasma avium]|uniref:Bifunctional protein GlmU n=1 Tax=Candidatus Faeciplasma avium TaxID=2840798 RepID=A0A9D1NPV4_9FIRM|nr:bifunctional UDP-N-acetylglucosamine diphosphorylase/glucosamine-1-phosphate N-acetyltransferase GlmU [Candidatus Faeciplasma avium]